MDLQQNGLAQRQVAGVSGHWGPANPVLDPEPYHLHLGSCVCLCDGFRSTVITDAPHPDSRRREKNTALQGTVFRSWKRCSVTTPTDLGKKTQRRNKP